MWILTCVVLFAAGYAASVYSWPMVKSWISVAATEADRLWERVAKLGTKLRDI